MEKIQLKATKMVPELRNLSYERRLQRLELISLEQRRLRGQLIETFKYLNGLNNVTLERLFERDCNVRTRNNGKRPFGVSILYMGWDRRHGYQLYQSDPSGNYSGWKATCIGNSSSAAVSILKQEYKDDLTVHKAQLLALRTLHKTLDITKLTHEKVELATLMRTDGTTKLHVLDADQVSALIKEHEAIEAEEEKKKQEKAGGSGSSSSKKD
ncbi:Proteasome subunit alpha/beta [Trinorchestia longiramus]|nr:Proteasome subunit alpha/beta [Trinorchestia longiramus]